MATATTTMTTSPAPRAHRSFNASAPPTSALPALPSSVSARSSLQRKPSSLLPQTPRAVSGFVRPPSINIAQRSSTPGQSMMGSPTSGLPEPRRVVSIASFPQPPRSVNRTASLPPSSLGSDSAASATNIHPPPSPGKKGRRITPLERTKSGSSGSLNGKYARDSGVGLLASPGATYGDMLSPTFNRSSSPLEGGYSPNRNSGAVTPTDAGALSPTSASMRRSRSMGNGDEKEGGNIVVSVRVRPDSIEDGCSPDWLVDGPRSTVGYRGRDGGVYEFDNVFTQIDDNSRVYDSCAKRLVRRVMEGYHGTVFAYGMTGTGKTFSMQGTTSSPGVIPLAITDIFSYIRETPHREFLLRVSYLEIYNERIHDLLASQPGSSGFVPLDQQTKGEEIKLREDPKRGVYATPLKEEIVQSPTQLLRVIARGDLARRTGSTQFNARSSRSHAVVQIVVESRERINGGASMADNRRHGVNGGVRVSTLSLIDLAGSERAAENKERRTEGAHINRSLLTLGTVIARLSKDADGKDKDGNHLPYRDSKLTRLLQPALSGNSLVSILCTIAIPQGMTSAATATNINEQLSTLKFAARAKNNLVSHAKRSEETFAGGVDAGSRVLLERYRTEIAELRRELEMQRKREEEDLKEREELAEMAERALSEERHGEQLLEMQLARTALKERIEHLNRLILCSRSSGVNSNRNSMMSINLGQSSRLSASSIIPPTTTPRDSTITTATSTTATVTVRDSSLTTASNFSSPATSTSSTDPETDPTATGIATLSVQFQSLQADLADKNRYIATLERRLLQARRSSQTRTSVGLSCASPRGNSMDLENAGISGVGESPYEALLQEKEQEIANLRAQLDDKERMLAALRSQVRKRDTATDVVTRRHPSIQRKGSVGSASLGRSRESLTEAIINGNSRSERESLRESIKEDAFLRHHNHRSSSRLSSRDSMKGMIPLQLQPGVICGSTGNSPIGLGLGFGRERRDSESEGKVKRLERKDSRVSGVGSRAGSVAGLRGGRRSLAGTPVIPSSGSPVEA